MEESERSVDPKAAHELLEGHGWKLTKKGETVFPGPGRGAVGWPAPRIAGWRRAPALMIPTAPYAPSRSRRRLPPTSERRPRRAPLAGSGEKVDQADFLERRRAKPRPTSPVPRNTSDAGADAGSGALETQEAERNAWLKRFGPSPTIVTLAPGGMAQTAGSEQKLPLIVPANPSVLTV